MSELYDLYQKVGKKAYGKAISSIAPYFSNIDATFIELKPGYCEVAVENQTSIHNHLGFIHVIAICNAAELVAGVGTDVSIPDNHHWIPIGMQTKYLAKAESNIRVIMSGEDIDWTVVGKIAVSVDAYDENATKVFSANIDMLVREKK